MHVEVKSSLVRFSSFFPTFVAIFFPITIPIFHILVLYYFWQAYARYVDKRFCSCSCWDTVFKGTYESGIASYKHFYFNATKNSMQIWILVVVGIISIHESMKYLCKLCISRQLRSSMAFLFCLSIFSHYYAWWSMLNYLNDDFWNQWNHQLFFTLTEIFSTAFVLHLANRENTVTPRKIMVIVGTAILHIFASSFDQFIKNVLLGFGYLHQILRDFGFMIPDLFHLILPLIVLRREYFSNNRTLHRDKTIRKDLFIMIILIGLAFLICSLL